MAMWGGEVRNKIIVIKSIVSLGEKNQLQHGTCRIVYIIRDEGMALNHCWNYH